MSNVGQVEAHVFADLVEGDAALVDEASNEPDIDSEALGQGTNVDERAVFLGRFLFCWGRWRGSSRVPAGNSGEPRLKRKEPLSRN